MNTPIDHALVPRAHDQYLVLDLDEFPYVWNPDPSSLVQIADDKRTKPDVLTILASHADPLIRSAVADNPSTPDAILLQLAVDNSADIRYQLAENHNLPLPVLFTLIKDENPYVEARAMRTINRLGADSKMQSL